MFKATNRFVEINGGLGNQMFQYAYYMRLRSIFPGVRTFISSKSWEHDGGYELERVFGIKHHESLWEKLYHKGRPWTTLFHYIHRRYQGRNFKFQHVDLRPDPKYGYFYGTWQSERYFSDEKLIRSVFRFNPAFLSQQTRAVANCLRGGVISVSVHIRRGDYLSDNFKDGFGACCDSDYYNSALELLKQRVGKDKEIVPVFFSDDMKWVKSTFKYLNAIFIDHNTGVNSWQDMYLMSICTHNIIANSTFSWWGAWLNTNKDKIVIAPSTWYNGINDDVVPTSWIRI